MHDTTLTTFGFSTVSCFDPRFLYYHFDRYIAFALDGEEAKHLELRRLIHPRLDSTRRHYSTLLDSRLFDL
jgi:hypothetical protein